MYKISTNKLGRTTTAHITAGQEAEEEQEQEEKKTTHTKEKGKFLLKQGGNHCKDADICVGAYANTESRMEGP